MRATAIAWRCPPDSRATATSIRGMLMPMSSSARRASRFISRLLSSGSGRMDALAAQEHVVVDGQFVDQRQVLVDGVDAFRARVVDALRFIRLAVQEHAARVLLLKAGDDLDQRRLARAVVAEQAEHLALAQVQVDVAQRRHGTEALGDVFDAQHVVGRRVTGASGWAGAIALGCAPSGGGCPVGAGGGSATRLPSPRALRRTR